jgi:Cu/Ag efflux protein CusF
MDKRRLEECFSTFARRVQAIAGAAAVAGVLATAGVAVAQQAPVVLSDAAELVTARATVQSVDAAKRKITLQAADGRSHTLKVSPKVDLSKVKAGDVVVASYYVGVASDIRPPSAGAPGLSGVVIEGRTRPHTLPGGEIVESIVYTFEVVGVEPQNNELVVIDPAGKVQTIQIVDPKVQAMLPSIKLGDKYDVVITEALAIAIEAPKK